MLQAGRPGDWIRVRARFSTLVQTCPGAHPGSCISDSRSLPRGVALTTDPIHRRGERKSSAIPLLPFRAFRACCGVNFILYLYIIIWVANYSSVCCYWRWCYMWVEYFLPQPMLSDPLQQRYFHVKFYSKSRSSLFFGMTGNYGNPMSGSGLVL
jgi:hypothetical protein